MKLAVMTVSHSRKIAIRLDKHHISKWINEKKLDWPAQPYVSIGCIHGFSLTNHDC